MCPGEIIRTPTMLRVVSGARFLSNWNSKVVKKNSDHLTILTLCPFIQVLKLFPAPFIESEVFSSDLRTHLKIIQWLRWERWWVFCPINSPLCRCARSTSRQFQRRWSKILATNTLFRPRQVKVWSVDVLILNLHPGHTCTYDNDGSVCFAVPPPDSDVSVLLIGRTRLISHCRTVLTSNASKWESHVIKLFSGRDCCRLWGVVPM